MDALLSLAKKRTFGKGENIFLIDQKATHIYQVITGKVDLYRYSANGQRITLYQARDGNFFAEASLNADKYHCTATCLTTTTVFSFDSNEVNSLLLNDSDFAMEWIFNLSGEMRRLRACMERLNLKTPVERITHYIDTEGIQAGEASIPGTLSELAEILNISRETLYRTLAFMEKEGVLERQANLLRLRKTYD